MALAVHTDAVVERHWSHAGTSRWRLARGLFGHWAPPVPIAHESSLARSGALHHPQQRPA
eukprot:1489811-Heterocapsa_arctica.AAC.1